MSDASQGVAVLVAILFLALAVSAALALFVACDCVKSRPANETEHSRCHVLWFVILAAAVRAASIFIWTMVKFSDADRQAWLLYLNETLADVVFLAVYVFYLRDLTDKYATGESAMLKRLNLIGLLFFLAFCLNYVLAAIVSFATGHFKMFAVVVNIAIVITYSFGTCAAATACTVLRPRLLGWELVDEYFRAKQGAAQCRRRCRLYCQCSVPARIRNRNDLSPEVLAFVEETNHMIRKIGILGTIYTIIFAFRSSLQFCFLTGIIPNNDDHPIRADGSTIVDPQLFDVLLYMIVEFIPGATMVITFRSLNLRRPKFQKGESRPLLGRPGASASHDPYRGVHPLPDNEQGGAVGYHAQATQPMYTGKRSARNSQTGLLAAKHGHMSRSYGSVAGSVPYSSPRQMASTPNSSGRMGMGGWAAPAASLPASTRRMSAHSGAGSSEDMRFHHHGSGSLVTDASAPPQSTRGISRGRSGLGGGVERVQGVTRMESTSTGSTTFSSHDANSGGLHSRAARSNGRSQPSIGQRASSSTISAEGYYGRTSPHTTPSSDLGRGIDGGRLVGTGTASTYSDRRTRPDEQALAVNPDTLLGPGGSQDGSESPYPSVLGLHSVPPFAGSSAPFLFEYRQQQHPPGSLPSGDIRPPSRQRGSSETPRAGPYASPAAVPDGTADGDGFGQFGGIGLSRPPQRRKHHHKRKKHKSKRQSRDKDKVSVA